MNCDFSLITCTMLPDLDPDDRLLARLLEEKGFRVQAAIWNDPSVVWERSGICIIRSTWDYHQDHQGFCRWINNTAKKTRLLNVPELLLWNSRKTYLQELEQQNIPIVPTHFIEAGSKENLSEILSAKTWAEAIVKPVVGLSTYGVQRVSAPDHISLAAGQKHLDSLLAAGGVMIQPYMDSVTGYGERSLMFFGGKFSHAVRKSAFQQLAVAGEAGETACQASASEIALGQKIIAFLPQTPAYARVDLVRDDSDRSLLMELELIEPSLFLSFSAEAPGKLADAILATAGMTDAIHS
ncbi:MAG: hypothetical protein K2W82_15470 [Candidatus Obscuribacterales bacterium]|nr:hypothetical protein [Candidatus Obscuribacterales bacterium]